ncbi:type 2 isopentenyl-diphosphate Delta-isomerase [Aneurinibacillus sp. Ricciae_BoGa-3]|uniref:type 2 isopentenyl-diphosphate Delta-isomerase n=1 Tax=Aneurinibacillus sp. Ricciae_BoGa-3 TaxID=3022697 RepID=UPI002340911A|nr:type 2 isopentenyl-diphosphate Delta-isomerase [Aneurinibacillus sp. Ricciae_BoGa-3]WCK56064.1 type 2 isopentenyl-diphosphate Delta-isomerase [Aneurinibacillus sp. Ricciae_BoGa-3]
MSRTSRKKEHIDRALAVGQSGKHGLDDVKFIHNALPDMDLSTVSHASTIGGLALSSPIVVNAMTGGARETHRINQILSIIAREAGLAMAVGSQMAAIHNPELVDTYRIARKENPKGILFANLGAEATPDMARRAIDMIEADGLQIHLNVMQELLMPEGDRDFSGASRRIQAIVDAVGVPVIVKEVGFGLSREACIRLVECGVSVFDVGGRGGTNFARIENARRAVPYDMLNNWGLTTASSLLEAADAKIHVRQGGRDFDTMATGGLQTALDIARAIAIGANCTGMAGFFLSYAVQDQVEEALDKVRGLHEQLDIILCALGAGSILDLQRIPVVIAGETFHWASQRGIDCSAYARRG